MLNFGTVPVVVRNLMGKISKSSVVKRSAKLLGAKKAQWPPIFSFKIDKNVIIYFLIC